MYSFANLEPVCCSMSSSVTSWPANRFLRRQVRWSCIPISWRIFHSPDSVLNTPGLPTSRSLHGLFLLPGHSLLISGLFLQALPWSHHLVMFTLTSALWVWTPIISLSLPGGFHSGTNYLILCYINYLFVMLIVYCKSDCKLYRVACLVRCFVHVLRAILDISCLIHIYPVRKLTIQ